LAQQGEDSIVLVGEDDVAAVVQLNDQVVGDVCGTVVVTAGKWANSQMQPGSMAQVSVVVVVVVTHRQCRT